MFDGSELGSTYQDMMFIPIFTEVSSIVLTFIFESGNTQTDRQTDR